MRVWLRGWERRLLYRCGGIGVTLLLWGLATSGVWGGGASEFIRDFSPWNTFHQFGGMVGEGVLTRHLLPSLGRFAAGLGLALAFGVPVGVLVGYFPRVTCRRRLRFSFCG